MSKFLTSMDSAIFISSMARKRPGQSLGPAPNGMDTFLLFPSDAGISQRSGRNAVASAKLASSIAATRVSSMMTVPFGMATSATVVSSTASATISGATGRKRIDSLMHASV